MIPIGDNNPRRSRPVVNYVLIALLMRISDEGGAAADTVDQSQFEKSEERRERLLRGD